MKGACQTLDIQKFIYIKLGWVYPMVAKLFEIMKKVHVHSNHGLLFKKNVKKRINKFTQPLNKNMLIV